jgi:hypothetical protein
MSIGKELSYDVAAAMLSRKEENPMKTEELLTVLINFHTALQPLMKQSRRRRWSSAANKGQAGNKVSSASSSLSG